MSVTMAMLSIKDLTVAISTRAGPAEDDPPLYKGVREQHLASKDLHIELMLDQSSC